jgi:hypothetical protein
MGAAQHRQNPPACRESGIKPFAVPLHLQAGIRRALPGAPIYALPGQLVHMCTERLTSRLTSPGRIVSGFVHDGRS